MTDLLIRLSEQLNDDLGGLTLDHPAGAILRRGRLLRARRRRAPVLAVLTVGLLAAQLSSTSPRHGSAVAATSWSAGAQPTDPATRAAVDAGCRSEGSDIPADLPLRSLDRRGDVAVAVYTDGRHGAGCVVFRGRQSETPWEQGGRGGVEPVSARGSGRPVAIEEELSAGISDHDAATAIFGWVSPGVARVQVVSNDGYATTATITGDLFTAWWPAQNPDRDPLSVPDVVTAYDVHGTVLGTDALHH